MGTLIESKEGAVGLVALNSLPSANLILEAVEPRNEPPIFNWAFWPKIIPLGLIKNKLAVPFALIKPSILDIFLPVTRLNIF